MLIMHQLSAALALVALRQGFREADAGCGRSLRRLGGVGLL